jgi:N-acetyl-gamma-glutamyl-phosphate reductase
VPNRVPVAIIGASGYTGGELMRILARHPGVRVAQVMAKRAAGQRVADVFPHLASAIDLPIAAFDAGAVATNAKLAFSALPHGDSAAVVAELRARNVAVLDLSADFRLRDAATWASWYGDAGHSSADTGVSGHQSGGSGSAVAAHAAHPAESLLAEAVYGLPERHRALIRNARLVAVPGCYPTAALLAAAPLLSAGLIAPDGIVIDAKSGASGAGRSPSPSLHLPEAAEGVRPYKVGGTHRHTPEIEQELGDAAGRELRVLFTPHLLPMSRGILSCVYARPSDPARPVTAYRDALATAYASEPFVDVLPAGALPDTAHVRGSNRAQVTAVFDLRTGVVLAISAIDNLVKGAAGQAVQCMNLILGLPETAGLDGLALFP